MISFSTCWNSGRHTDGGEMLREIKDLGFDRVELGHGIRLSLIPGIEKMFDAGVVQFSSLHNFCPLPVEIMEASPDCYKFSAAHSIEHLGAPFVVLHCGQVEMNPITDELIALAKRGEIFSRKYVRMKLKAVQKREAAAPPYLERVKNSLRQLAEYAARKNIRLGVEGRRGYEEIPSERELPSLLDELDSSQLGYWHDMGHLQIKENLGFVNHEEWLRRMGMRAFGCHMQDCIWPAQDHQPPFAGMVNLEKLVPLLPANCLFVWEMSPRKTPEEIRRSVALW
jgi:sugar phosphate isomerase/epimerase